MMNKNFVVALLIILSITTNATGQLRHVKGIECVGLAINKMNSGFGGELFYEKLLTNSVIIKVGGYYEKRDINYANYNAYGILPEIYKTVLNNKRSIFVDLSGGINFGYEFARSEVTNDKVNNFVIGERIGICLEYFITSSLKIELRANQIFIQKSKFLKYGQIYGLGIIYKI